jgi:VIT1/CCC1 family predicted Fe2+/Mn2+ transporter
MPATKDLSDEVMAQVLKSQRDEALGSAAYAYMAAHERDEANARTLSQMSADELTHEQVWAQVSGQEVRVPRGKLLAVKAMTRVLGFTFTLKRLENDEQLAQDGYRRLQAELPQAARMLDEERAHEERLEGMLDEERLHYVGSMVLGLNDALVELTGAIAGVTFSLANARLVALTGIITGIAATLSMAASNYLAEQAEGHDDALKSSVYTGAAYLVTVALLVTPYLLFPEDMYAAAFAVMLCIVVIVIAAFNYYLSVATDQPFGSRFVQMTAISLGVAAISFAIGLAAKALLGIDV